MLLFINNSCRSNQVRRIFFITQILSSNNSCITIIYLFAFFVLSENRENFALITVNDLVNTFFKLYRLSSYIHICICTYVLIPGRLRIDNILVLGRFLFRICFRLQIAWNFRGFPQSITKLSGL
jgi:hypothetical protein